MTLYHGEEAPWEQALQPLRARIEALEEKVKVLEASPVDELLRVLAPFVKQTDAGSLIQALGHIGRDDLTEARRVFERYKG